MMLAHGCYWAKCAFCDTALDYICRYESVPAAQLVDWMEQVMGQTGSRGFHFVDEAASPTMLRELSLEILRRYEHDEVCVARSQVLPTPSNQKMNAYLKEIAAVCGINKVLTTHVARHTFACMAVEYGMPIDVLAKILGHSNTNMTRHYAKFSETVIGREMEAFGERLASAT